MREQMVKWIADHPRETLAAMEICVDPVTLIRCIIESVMNQENESK